MNKKLAGILIIPPIILATIVILYGGLFTENYLNVRPPESVRMRLAIDYQGFAPNEEYNLSLSPEKQTMYDAMVLAGLDMETTGPGVFLFVEAINGIRNNQDRNNRWWQFWVNGELAPVGVGSYRVHEGENIEWRYTHPNIN